MTKTFLCLSVIFLAFLLLGCPYESPLPLSLSSESEIDSELLGKWIWHGDDPDEEGLIWIYNFNDKEYLIELYDSDKDEYIKFRGFSTIIKDTKILNISEIELNKNDIKYIFVKYNIINNKLIYQTIEDKLIKETYKSPKELLYIISKYIHNDELYSEHTVLERVQEDDESN